MFEAVIDNVNKLCFFSDIHGDIMGLIVNLRDCAKVIKKKEKYNFKQDEIDVDLINLLDINLNLNSDSNSIYINDLNYEWIGGDTHVVIIGDILDNMRDYMNSSRMEGEVIHEEIKLLLFINAIDDLAKKQGGRIIKLLGNHDYIAVISPEVYEQYQSKFAKREENNYHNIPRNIFFTTEEGKNLLKYNGVGVILKINDYICVHGSFTGLKTFKNDYMFNDLQKINDLYLDYIFNNKDIDSKYLTFLNDSKGGLLFDRSYGDSTVISRLYKKDKTTNLSLFDEKFCKNIVIKNSYINPYEYLLVFLHFLQTSPAVI